MGVRPLSKMQALVALRLRAQTTEAPLYAQLHTDQRRSLFHSESAFIGRALASREHDFLKDIQRQSRTRDCAAPVVQCSFSV